jgi:hypothetical protein
MEEITVRGRVYLLMALKLKEIGFAGHIHVKKIMVKI